MNTVLEFWFDTLTPEDWYKKSDAMDQRILDQFQSLWHQVRAGETAHWRDSPDGRLAEIIVLDQFSRNMFRGTPEAFSSDPMALALAQEAVRHRADQALNDERRAFLYMPYMHSESAFVHQHALKLFEGLVGFDFEVKHKAIIDQFGRYPHRNEILGRPSTTEEIEWMRHNDGF